MKNEPQQCLEVIQQLVLLSVIAKKRKNHDDQMRQLSQEEKTVYDYF